MTIRLPQDRRGEQGAWLFLASLAVFFLGSLLLYAIYVALRSAPPGQSRPSFYLPVSFIWTSMVLVAISICLHMATGYMRRERRMDVWRCVIIASILCFLFFALQSGGMYYMIAELLASSQQDRSLYGFTFFLVLVHALHVIGGAAGLTFILFGLARESYDHESFFPIRFCALYWHFLDVVWFIMLACFAFAAAMSNRTA